MSQHPLVLVDLSSISYLLWHLSGNEPDPNWTSTQILAKVHALASGQPHVAICVDGPRSRALRKAIDPTYKAQRDTAPEALFHQIACAIDALKADGFPVWEADGYEADDVIASAVNYVLAHTAWDPTTDADVLRARAATTEIPDAHCLVVTADKDLCQLVGPRVTIKHALKGDLLDEAAVIAKFGVRPDQIKDYLSLVGDASDNIKGAKGIGPKTAAKLLAQHGTLATILTPAVADAQTPAVKDALYDFAIRADVVQSLIALRTDVPVDIATAFVERVPQEETMAETTQTDAPQTSEAPSRVPDAGREPESRVDRAVETASVDFAQRQRAEVEPMQPLPAPSASLVHVPYEMQLEPRSMAEARQLAADMHASRLFSAYGTPAAVLSTILAGRELGLQAMASLRAMHIIEGKPTLSAGAIQSLVLKSKLCTYFRCTERTLTHATFVGKRGDDPEVTLTFTVEDARRAWSGDPAKFEKSGWGRNPADLCVARAATKLARLLWPDVCAGFYAKEEFE